MGVETIIEYFMKNPSIFFFVFLLYCFIVSVSVFFGGSKPGRNPFREEHIRPRKPLVTDKKARDAVLKQRFKQSKIPSDLDAIVIGSGVGGLSAAVLLSRVGKKVLVLEQHDVAGGCCHTFIEKGFEFDTGIHYIGEMDGKTWTHVLVDQLTEGQLDWVPMDQEYDVVAIGEPGKAKRYPMKSGPNQEYWDQLKALFPHNTEDVDKFRDLMLKVRKSAYAHYMLKFMPLWLARLLVVTGVYRLMYRDYFAYSQCSLQDVLDGLTNNADLKAVLSYIIGDYGLSPSEAPFTLHLSVINHYHKGAYYVNGGSSEIPFQMIKNIERYGGRVLIQAPVTKILTNEKGRVTGVRVHKSSGDVDVLAKMVISDAGAINTFKKLLPVEIAVKSPLYPVMEKLGSGCSFITVFVGLAGSSSELGLKASNTWSYLSNDLCGILGDYMSLSVEDLETAEIPLLFVSFPSAKDPSWEDRYPGKSSALLITYANWEWFSKWKDETVRHRGDHYEQIKTAIGQQMWKQCCDLFPQIADKLEYFEVGTPVSNSFYLGGPKGEAYGLNLTKTRFTLDSCLNLRPETGIPGLFLTGQDTSVAGMMGAIMGSVICVSKILNRNVFTDLIKLYKTLKHKKNTKNKKE
ncbi:all-trans-retinol 13,14-reductase-like [Gigantopelta aegis]|uniref:all-trans-retinol 13,14-reductase-like n=1 Tax=Gigantopelta aegis TaxID=1735272 RepID=UPI001B887533|nr:all-trans-retinol 13,14-reductase-like [Gigantopelta aegis]